MLNKLEPGDAFLLETSPNDKHLFVVIAPTGYANFLCVNLTKKRNNSDNSCILEPGDHPFIRYSSVINYRDAREISPAVITKLISEKKFILRDPFSKSVLKKIQDGGIKSGRLKNKYKKRLKSFLGYA